MALDKTTVERDTLPVAKHYRIFSPDGAHVATVKPEHVEEHLALYNGTYRELDIDGNPIGEYTAQAYDGFVQGNS